MSKAKVVVKGVTGNHSVHIENASTVALEISRWVIAQDQDMDKGKDTDIMFTCQAVEGSMHEQGGRGEKVGDSAMDLGLGR